MTQFSIPTSETVVLDLERLCRMTLQERFTAFRGVQIVAEFYPYVDLSHTIRRRGQAWVLRISDFCRYAPPNVVQAIAVILGCKVLRRKPSDDVLRMYEEFRLDPIVREAIHKRRLERGRKQIRAGGEHHRLEEIYEEVNGRFFNGQVEIRKLGWGPRPSWGRLGHYDPVHNTITISPVLDSASVPRSVVSYLVYHELLHALFGDVMKDSRRRHHSREFRQAEQAYPDYKSATAFLEKFCRTRRAHRAR